MKMFPLEYTERQGVMNIRDLWVSVAALSSGRVKDNVVTGEYPLEAREIQLMSLKSLVAAIESTHNDMKRSVVNESR